MSRYVLLTAVFTALAAWASAQPPTAGPIASERWRLFKKNQTLLENLVGRTVDLANADTSLARVRACHETAAALGRALGAARDDPDRVVELGEYLSVVITDGLVPALDTARRDIAVGSTDEKELFRLHRLAADDADRAAGGIPHIGAVGTSVRVKGAVQKLAAAQGRLAEAIPPVSTPGE